MGYILSQKTGAAREMLSHVDAKCNPNQALSLAKRRGTE